MNIEEKQHPDTLSDWAAFKNINCGGKQAIYDIAIAAYHKSLEQGDTKQQAEDIYFKVLVK